MKIYKTIPVHIEERIELDKLVCDICKQEYEEHDGWEMNEVSVNARIGSVYPESDDRTFYVIDVCPECFLNKVKVLIEREFNVKFREIESEERDGIIENEE